MSIGSMNSKECVISVKRGVMKVRRIGLHNGGSGPVAVHFTRILGSGNARLCLSGLHDTLIASVCAPTTSNRFI